MSIHINDLTPLVAIAAGIGILVFPKFMRYIIATFLIVFGIIELGIINL